MVFRGAIVVDFAVYIAVGIDNRFRNDLSVFFVNAHFGQGSADLFVIFFIVEIVAAKLHTDDITAIQTDHGFSFQVAPVDAGHAHGAADAARVCAAADLRVVEIVAGSVDGRNRAFVQLDQIRLIRIHGVKSEIVVGVGKINPAAHLAEISAVVQISGRVSDGKFVVHGNAAAQYSE